MKILKLLPSRVMNTIVYPKYKKGGYIVQKVLVKPYVHVYAVVCNNTFWHNMLMAETTKWCTAGTTPTNQKFPRHLHLHMKGQGHSFKYKVDLNHD